MTVKAVWHIVKESAKRIGVAKLAPHDLRRTCARLCHASGGELEQIQFLLGMCQSKRPSVIWAASNGSVQQLTIASGSSLVPKPLGGSGRIADYTAAEEPIAGL